MEVILRSARIPFKKVVDGVPVTIGVISDLFAATPHWCYDQTIDKTKWNITHIPSGFSYQVKAETPEVAVKLFEAKCLRVGKKEYQRAVRAAMKRILA